MDPLFRLKSRSLVDWGDYGDMLGHGMTAHLERVNGMLQLERTAPFVPPISAYFDTVITEETSY